jgi:5-methylcytosine-specific restriction protein A
VKRSDSPGDYPNSRHKSYSLAVIQRFLESKGMAIVHGHEALPVSYPDEIEPHTYAEGAGKTVTVNRYERDEGARSACIAHYGARCQVCALDFSARYGAIGEGFIHVHHLVPLSEIGRAYQVDAIRDLRPVCPNCHAMLHRQKPEPYTVVELRAQLRPGA